MSVIVFKNPGEIDILSISSFGVSVKEGDSPIGFFGTGLKYAIAVLLRNDHEVTVHSGKDEVRFMLQRKNVRGKEFDFVAMSVNDQPPQQLGFTTELGKTWEMWMSYREIACNCKDEGGTVSRDVASPYPKAGETHVIVSGGEFTKIHQQRHEFILEDTVASHEGNVEIRNRPGSSFYYRGIRVQDFARRGMFTYNNTGKMDLTEDRTLKYQWEPEYIIRGIIMRSEDSEFIRKCVTGHKDTLEGGMDYHGYSIAPSPTFLKVVGECQAERLTDLNETALRVWKETTKQPFSPQEIGLTKVQLRSLDKALDFCGKIGFSIRDAYPIKFCESLGEGCLGMAHDRTIFIAENVFNHGGTKLLASTLIEEYLHLRHGWEDMSRQMQNFLFDKVVSLGEELVGEPL